MIRTLLISLAISSVALAQTEAKKKAPPVPPPPPKAAEKAPDSIGSAKMLPDGTLELMLRAEGPNAVGDALLRYGPKDPRYKEILEHVGKDMKPGETRAVKPFPPKPTDLTLPDDAPPKSEARKKTP